MKKIVFSDHALFQMQRRSISEDAVREIIQNSGQTEEVRPGRMIFQSRIMSGEPGKEFLIRVFVDVVREGVEVVTVYRTSKIDKYWK
jgi:hypothetical protein